MLDRIASQVLNNPKEKSSSVWNSGVASETGKDEHAAVVILVSLCLFPSSRAYGNNYFCNAWFYPLV